MKIGLLIIATNKYTEFLQPLITSADKYFLKNQLSIHQRNLPFLLYHILRQRNWNKYIHQY